MPESVGRVEGGTVTAGLLDRSVIDVESGVVVWLRTLALAAAPKTRQAASKKVCKALLLMLSVWRPASTSHSSERSLSDRQRAQRWPVGTRGYLSNLICSLLAHF